MKPGLRGAGMARSPGAARAAEEELEREEKPAAEKGGTPEGSKSEDASMARSAAAAHKGEDREISESHGSDAGHTTTVSSGRGIGSKSVETEHAMGRVDRVTAKGAEGESDTASSKANRKENGEPEREEAEQSAIGSREVEHSNTFGKGMGREVPTKNVMGHGQRETIAKNTI